MEDNFVHTGQFPGWPTVDLVKQLLKADDKYIDLGKLQAHMNRVKSACTEDFYAKKHLEFPKGGVEFPKAEDVPSTKRFRNASSSDVSDERCNSVASRSFP